MQLHPSNNTDRWYFRIAWSFVGILKVMILILVVGLIILTVNYALLPFIKIIGAFLSMLFKAAGQG